MELRSRERQAGDLWRCVVLPRQEREGKALLYSSAKTLSFSILIIYLSVFRQYQRWFYLRMGVLQILAQLPSWFHSLFQLFPGASQAAKKEELGSSEKHSGQHGQCHLPHHLVWGPAVPVRQPHFCRGWRAAKYERMLFTFQSTHRKQTVYLCNCTEIVIICWQIWTRRMP